MSDLTTVARPYAKAAFAYAVENESISEWEDMLGFAAEVAKHEAVKGLLSSSMTADKLAEVFVNLCGEQLNDKGQNLIKVMAENGRLPAMPDVAELFAALREEFEKEVTVYVTSATKLSKKQQDSISEALEKRLSRKIKMNCSVDPSVVGGLIVKANDIVIDGSIRGKLDRLADTLNS